MAIKSFRRSALVLGLASLTAIGTWCLTLGATAPEAPAEQTTRPAARPQAPQASGEFPMSWFYPNRRTGTRYTHHVAMEGKAAPKYTLNNWIGDEVKFEDTKGKIVVIDFWATWCRPCMRAVPKNVKMVNKYKDKGLLFIGIHDHRRGTERMAAAVKANRMNYPVAIDKDGLSQCAFKVSFWPTYVVIDHRGVVRAAGIIPDYVEMVVEKLMKEREADMKG